MSTLESNEKRKRIFIGSSSESREAADWIASLVALDHEPLPWYDLDAFQAGDIILPRLIEISNEVTAAILIFSEDDKTESRGVSRPSPRDNVLLEFGLFARAVGLKNAIICTAGNPKLPIDTAGITRIDISNKYIAKPILMKWFESLKKRKHVNPEEINIGYFKHADHGSFTSRLGDRLTNATNIKMMGSGVAILGNPVLVDQIMRRASDGVCDVEIYLANPFSPTVEMRLIEEEQGTVRPPDGKRGLLDRLKTLLAVRQSARCADTVRINLCNQYPTFALIKVDDDYFVYPYAYKTLGNFSPVLVFSQHVPEHTDIIAFLDKHYECVRADSLDAERVIQARVDVLNGVAHFSSEELFGFAVFFVPPCNSKLYRFGTRILGYDLHDKHTAQSKWEHYIGRAGEFGFHLTICDALYFRNEAERRIAATEVSFLSSEFEPFELQDLKLEYCFPNNQSVAITARELSGQLEALHSEFVQRFYRRASASDYTLGRGDLDRSTNGKDRRFIIRRYHVPYILSEYKPHFTLLSKYRYSAADDSGDLRRLFETEVKESTIEVSDLAIMIRNPGDERWSIAQLIELGRR